MRESYPQQSLPCVTCHLLPLALILAVSRTIPQPHTTYCPAALITLQGIVTYTFGNTLMSAHFASHGEASALMVQLVSIINNFLILSQVRGLRDRLK